MPKILISSQKSDIFNIYETSSRFNVQLAQQVYVMETDTDFYCNIDDIKSVFRGIGFLTGLAVKPVVKIIICVNFSTPDQR